MSVLTTLNSLLDSGDEKLRDISSEEAQILFNFSNNAANDYENVNLFRNTVFLRLVAKYGLLGSIKQADGLYDNLVMHGEKPSNNKRILCDTLVLLSSLSLLQDQLKKYYSIVVLEKIDSIIETGDIPSVEWLLDESSVKDLIAPLNISSQFYIKGTINSEKLDKKQDILAYEQRKSHIKGAYNNIFAGRTFQSVQVEVQKTNEKIDSFCKDPKNADFANSLNYFRIFSSSVLRDLPKKFEEPSFHDKRSTSLQKQINMF